MSENQDEPNTQVGSAISAIIILIAMIILTLILFNSMLKRQTGFDEAVKDTEVIDIRSINP